MKPSTIKNQFYSFLKIYYVLTVITILLLTSCADDALLTDERLQEQPIPEVGSINDESFPTPSLTSCPDDLVHDGCNFISGTGRDYPNQYLMVDLMNNCRTESLPSNCTWAGNITETRDIEVDLNNCCYPFSAFNGVMNNWKALAGSNRPAANYLIIEYQRISGFMVTTYGPYRMKIRVTYRKKGICSLDAEKRK